LIVVIFNHFLHPVISRIVGKFGIGFYRYGSRRRDYLRVQQIHIPEDVTNE
jgi:hypothetical protein